MLRDAREARGIPLDQAERETRIRAKYISAIEDDKPAILPGPVYARGFVRNYAAYLGVDVDEALELFDEQSQPTRNKIRAARGEPIPAKKEKSDAKKYSIQPLSKDPIDTRVRYGSSYIAVSLLALPLIILFYYVYSVYAGPNREVPIATPVSRPPTVTIMPLPSVVAGGVVTGTGDFQTPTTYVPQSPGVAQPTTAVGGPGVQPTSELQAGDTITVQVDITRDAWMRVLVDGVQQYNGTLAKGATRKWTGDKSVRIRTGRADSVTVTVNSSNRGLMGSPNNLIVEKEWSSDGTEKLIR